jgi:iron complex outermembrane receptor protein
MDTHGRDIGYSVKLDVPLQGGDTLRLGNEYHRAELDDWWPPVGTGMMSPNTYTNINNGKRERIVLFAEWDAKLNTQWSSLLGIRSETVNTDADSVQGYNATYATAANAFNASNRAKRDNNIDLTALFKYEASSSENLEFGYARKTRSPNLYERYSWGRSTMAMTMNGWFGDANGYVGNVGLKPEVAHTVSATMDWHDPDTSSWNVRLSPFYTYVQDFIDADRIGSFARYGRNLSLLQFANHDAHLYGLNLSWQAPVWNSTAYGVGEFSGKIDWTRGKRNDGGDLYHIMPVNLTLVLGQQLEAWSNTMELQLVASKTSVDTQRNEDKTGGYALANLGTRYRLSSTVTLQAGIRNLFDRQYQLPLGGADIASAKAGVSTLGPLAGQGRSIDVGLKLTF